MKNVRISATLGVFLTLIFHGYALPNTVKIGAIFHGDSLDEEAVFELAIEEIRKDRNAGEFVLEPVVKWVNTSTDGMGAAAAACELLKEGVAVIFGPKSPYMRPIVSSIAAHHDVPHIEYAWRSIEDSTLGYTTTNFHPSGRDVANAIADLTKTMPWQKFTAIYETDEGLSRIQETLKLHGPDSSPIPVRQLDKGSDQRIFLKKIAATGEVNLIVDVDPKSIINLLTQANDINLMKKYHNYIISGLDLPGYGLLEHLGTAYANITGFGLLTDYGRNKLQASLPRFKITPEAALLYDAVFFFNEALEDLHSANTEMDEPLELVPVPLTCYEGNKYAAGRNLTDVIRSKSITNGVSGNIEFDETGQRRNFELGIFEFQTTRIVKIGHFDSNGLEYTRSEDERQEEIREQMKNTTYRVTTRIGPPFLREINVSSTDGIMIGDKRYDGYSVELIHAVSKILHFSYTFELVPDGNYGSYNAENKSWDGLIQRLREHAADLAICDMTINRQRETVVDFTKPFMNLGISILFTKPPEPEKNLFSFLSPFTAEVWVFVATAYLLVSVMLFILARAAPGEWDNPHPCNPDPEELENTFNLLNSMWLTIGTLMQQGSDLLPKAPSIRMLAGIWWFFVLIMTSSYTANLAAFLTANKMEETVSNAEELAGQKEIKYGAVKGGSTSLFFRDSNISIYQRMWASMNEAAPSVFTASNDEGVQRVLTGKRKYAFIMESTAIEYHVQRNCDLEQIGGLLDSKGYGIAMPLNSPYRTQISKAILLLQERGELKKLKDRWWTKKYIDEPCKTEEAKDAASEIELGIGNVGGVFLVLGLGCAISLIVGILEFLWNVRQVAVEEMVTPWEAFVAESKFAMNIWADTKPVKVTKSSCRSSTSALAGNTGIGRAASVARSMVGSFLRLDMLDTFDKENTSNTKGGNQKSN